VIPAKAVGELGELGELGEEFWPHTAFALLCTMCCPLELKSHTLAPVKAHFTAA
jgi:hypothetical protein